MCKPENAVYVFMNEWSAFYKRKNCIKWIGSSEVKECESIKQQIREDY